MYALHRWRWFIGYHLPPIVGSFIGSLPSIVAVA